MVSDARVLRRKNDTRIRPPSSQTGQIHDHNENGHVENAEY